MGRLLRPLRLVQFHSPPPDTPHDARDGRWHHEPHVDDVGNTGGCMNHLPNRGYMPNLISIDRCEYKATTNSLDRAVFSIMKEQRMKFTLSARKGLPP